MVQAWLTNHTHRWPSKPFSYGQEWLMKTDGAFDLSQFGSMAIA